MNLLGDQLLTDAALAEDQHGAVGGRHALDQSSNCSPINGLFQTKVWYPWSVLTWSCRRSISFRTR